MVLMQIKDKCEFCTKSQCVGINKDGSLKFGCKDSYCIFDPIVENPYRDMVKNEYKKILK
jgi:hypothetical protein